MRRLFFALLLAAATPAFALPVNEALVKYRTLSTEQKFTEALEILQQSETEHPENVEVKFAIIRVLAWQGNYDAAEVKLQSLDAKHADNADLLLLRATLASYRQNYAVAESLYRQILVKNPNYEDAKAGLQRTLKAKKSAEVAIPPVKGDREAHESPAVPAEAQWQLDSGFEYSGFSRSNQPDWNQEFLQITHFLDGGKTAIHGKVTRYDQFSSVDGELEAGIDHAVSDEIMLYASGNVSPNANFRPEFWATGGGALRINRDSNIFFPVWLTFDGRYDDYADTNILTGKLGLRIEPVDGWSLAARAIALDQDGAEMLYGKDVRLDGTITDALRIYVGYADVPETVASETVSTQTWFGGFAMDLTPVTVLRVGYARDDRENSYIRQVVNASISYRF